MEADKFGESGTVDVGHRLVHLDLKGAAPRLNYLEKIFPLLSAWGATGLLIEYEDMFPFSKELEKLRGSCSYSNLQIAEILSLAAYNKLEVIPLVQTFGHFEFVLKHDEFRYLREVELYPNALCPCHPDSLQLVMKIIQQVIELHQNINNIHIGADEIWHLGKCEQCKAAMQFRDWSLSDLYLDWVSNVAKLVRAAYPALNIIIWDDMMRTSSSSKLEEYGMGLLVEPMIWKYESCNFALPPGMFDTFSKVFNRIWIASSFKGATGSTQFLPPIQHHIDNQLTWLSILKEHGYKFRKIMGIALTGWQRYDHYAVLCELLPVSVPSLALCLRVILRGSFLEEDHNLLSQELGFSHKINVVPFPRPQALEQGMAFPGHEIYVAVQMWSNFVYKYQTICNSESMLGWFSDYFRAKNFTNPAQVESVLHPMIELQDSLNELRKSMEKYLLEVYYEDTVEEWVGCFFMPLLKRIETIVEDCKHQIEVGGREKMQTQLI